VFWILAHLASFRNDALQSDSRHFPIAMLDFVTGAVSADAKMFSAAEMNVLRMADRLEKVVVRKVGTWMRGGSSTRLVLRV
jgi:hypothetical protein